jgi:hypothetical protein
MMPRAMMPRAPPPFPLHAQTGVARLLRCRNHQGRELSEREKKEDPISQARKTNRPVRSKGRKIKPRKKPEQEEEEEEEEQQQQQQQQEEEEEEEQEQEDEQE